MSRIEAGGESLRVDIDPEADNFVPLGLGENRRFDVSSPGHGSLNELRQLSEGHVETPTLFGEHQGQSARKISHSDSMSDRSDTSEQVTR